MRYPGPLRILAVVGPTAGAALFEVALSLWHTGAIHWPEVLSRTAFMAVGALLFSLVMFRLIDQQSEALRSQRRRLEAMFENSSEAVLLVDQSRRITALNPAAEAMLGYPARPQELPLCSLCVPAEGAGCPEGCPLHLNRPRPFFESMVRHRSGTLLPVAVSTSSLPPAESGTAEFMLTLVDISRYRDLQHSKVSRLLTLRTLEAQEEERRRLARELHDGIAQELYGLKLAAQVGRPLDERISELMDDVGRLAKSLWPPVLEKLGLVQALRAHADSLGPGRVALTAPDGFPRLPMALEATLFRIAQEAVGNALRHAGPGTVRVRLGQVGDDVCMEVEDDGAGFDPAHPPQLGLGLAGMRERAEGLGGALQVASGPGCGTRITVRIPQEVKSIV